MLNENSIDRLRILIEFDKTGKLIFDEPTIKYVKKLDNGIVKAYFCEILDTGFILSGSVINQNPTPSFGSGLNL
ncbi:MAG: hypothetical protein EXR80_08635 [Methylococcales bacterium]|nr:hypothetical protein [Methylococcales bacterium]